MFPKIVGFPPKSSILIGFSMIFTIHFGSVPPIFGNTQVEVFFKLHSPEKKTGLFSFPQLEGRDLLPAIRSSRKSCRTSIHVILGEGEGECNNVTNLTSKCDVVFALSQLSITCILYIRVYYIYNTWEVFLCSF